MLQAFDTQKAEAAVGGAAGAGIAIEIIVAIALGVLVITSVISIIKTIASKED